MGSIKGTVAFQGNCMGMDNIYTYKGVIQFDRIYYWMGLDNDQIGKIH